MTVLPIDPAIDFHPVRRYAFRGKPAFGFHKTGFRYNDKKNFSKLPTVPPGGLESILPLPCGSRKPPMPGQPALTRLLHPCFPNTPPEKTGKRISGSGRIYRLGLYCLLSKHTFSFQTAGALFPQCQHQD